jgi:hypothetical protein
MKSIYISDELHRRAKLKAAEAGVPLKDLIEQWIERGLRAAPLSVSETPVQIREPTALNEVQTAPIDMVASPSHIVFMNEMAQKGLLVGSARLRKQLHADYLAARQALDVSTPPLTEPPSVEEVRASFRHQRELFPAAPTVAELLIQMREEE